MKIALFADAYPPYQSSASIQLADLVQRYTRNGHEVTVFTSSKIPQGNKEIRLSKNLNIVRIKGLQTKNVNFFKRAVAESLIPLTTLIAFFINNNKNIRWDGIIWYSPTIFFGISIFIIKKFTKCKSYLILRDIFPEWALDVGHLKKGPIYYYFRFFEMIQYFAADKIGIQSQSNIEYFKKNYKSQLHKVEVLNNWLSVMPCNKSSINIKKSSLKDRFNFIYAGNMGSAQGLENIINFATELKDRDDIGFIFVGDGDEKKKLKEISVNKDLMNILFFDSIPHDEIADLYKQCDMGIISLDPKHKTHNIPGKLLSYIQNGLPVFAIVNEGNDIIDIIRNGKIGIASTSTNPSHLAELFIKNYKLFYNQESIRKRCRLLSEKYFSDSRAYLQTIHGLKNDSF